MNRYQAIRISRMIQNGLTSQEYHDAYSELLKSCSDTEPCPVPTPQPTVTISATSTANPPPPSTPKPLGPEWWKERQAEAAQEQMEIIKAQLQKIQSLQKQIAEDREHWDKQAVIDKGHREHNDELVAANGEIYEALKHWGLVQSEPCSLVDNVKQVIQLCAERGKAHFEQKDKIERLNDQIDSQSKVIAELTNQRDQWEKLAAKRSGEMNRRSDMIDIMEKQCDRKDKEIESKTKVIESLKKSIEVLDMVGKTRQQFADTDREVNNRKVEALKLEIQNRKQFSAADRVINHNKTVEIEALKKQLAVAGKKRQAIVEAGNKMANQFRLICNHYWLYDDELINSKQVIQLWQDNTTP